MPSETQHRKVSVRTAPKLVPFLAGAVLLAFTVAVIVVYNTPEDPNYSRTSSVGYITLVLCMPALALAATAWLVLERVLRRRSTTYDIKPAGER
ncbi:hypothetical protein [Nesterenkonia sphaerica]|uniref:Uncharacterized protein n=1 Tax=Nesterenkonia sphaerica TaxID=1804988 RepID=A0A5R9A332_9MICC|nr:hypothetical protein [Nesterenkonia sphaerica]TLP73093.1 hypothetical protein FEF27_10785 [Nesterenkonia sphaerica]